MIPAWQETQRQRVTPLETAEQEETLPASETGYTSPGSRGRLSLAGGLANASPRFEQAVRNRWIQYTREESYFRY